MHRGDERDRRIGGGERAQRVAHGRRSTAPPTPSSPPWSTGTAARRKPASASASKSACSRWRRALPFGALLLPLSGQLHDGFLDRCDRDCCGHGAQSSAPAPPNPAVRGGSVGFRRCSRRGGTMLEFDPLDEYPIHQVPLPMRYVGPSDRHFYDRCIYQGVDHDADAFFITGLGVYPNLGVIDAFATVRRGDRQWAVRMSGPRPDDKLRQEVGPYRIEVVEPLPRDPHLLRRRRARDRLRPALLLRVRPDLRAGARPAPGRPHPARRIAVRRCRHLVGRASSRRRDDRGRRPTASPLPVTVPGGSGRSANRNRRDGRANSTGCGGTGSRSASTTSRCT